VKDIIDRYEESRFPGLLEVLFFMILILDLLLAVWMSFMAPLHIEKMPYLKIVYAALIPLAYVFPIVDAIVIKKAKKHLLRINNIYLVYRLAYSAFVFVNETRYRLADVSAEIGKDAYLSIVGSGIFNIACTVIFSVAWIFAINTSKKVKFHIAN
jgi:hypothetical protein